MEKQLAKKRKKGKKIDKAKTLAKNAIPGY